MAGLEPALLPLSRRPWHENVPSGCGWWLPDGCGGCSVSDRSERAHLLQRRRPDLAVQLPGLSSTGRSRPDVADFLRAIAPMGQGIKTAVTSKKMPPWFADPEFGHFANERRLSASEIATLTAWADAGAPAGNPRTRRPPPFRERLEHQARRHRRDAEAVRAAGDRNRQLQVRRRQNRLQGRHVGRRPPRCGRATRRCSTTARCGCGRPDRSG